MKNKKRVNNAQSADEMLVIHYDTDYPNASLQVSTSGDQLHINQVFNSSPMYAGSNNDTLVFSYKEDTDMPKKLSWHNPGDNEFQSGVRDVALFTMGKNGVYEKGVAWNGVTAINENPSGADATDLFADDVEYATLRSAEQYGFSIEAYTNPVEWYECDGNTEVAPGVYLGQQNRKAFALVYKTSIGDEVHPSVDKGYILHITYNSTASPSGRGYQTINNSPNAMTMSWDCNATPVKVTGHKSVSTITLNSTKCDPAKLEAIENVLYGSDNADAALLMPDDLLAML